MSSVSEDMYPQLLDKASLCAHSESCSIESAELYLKEIVHVQSGCAAGTLNGKGVCDDVLVVSEVVADLREKITIGAEREVKTFWDKRQDELTELATHAESPLTSPLKPAYLALAALYTVAIISIVTPASMAAMNAGGVVPLTGQEIWWAVQGGYVGDLVNHAIHNGGLLVGDATPVVSGLSPQEVWWSVRDGYADQTLFSSAAAVGGVESVPFTPQEVVWSVQNGYAADMVAHWFRNGGLVV